ncbi:MAG: hypothetical protein AAGB00_04135 [Planctomycetota bacterium]
MDFLNQAIKQTRELFDSMTPAARVTSVLLLGVIVVSLGYLLQHQAASPDDYLFEGEFLAPRDADNVEAAITQANLNNYVREGGRFKVPRAQKADYMGAVADAGALPPNFHGILEKALDANPFTDRETRRHMVKNANEKRLSMIVGSMEGVQSAQVLYDIREHKGLSRRDEITATVSVTPSAEGLDPRRARMIRKAVAGAIAGLKTEDVTVVNNRDGSSYFGEGGMADFEDPYFATRLKYEKHLGSEIEKVLLHIPGVVVSVAAELDEAISRKTESLVPEGETASLRESSDTSESTQTRSGVEGRPGLLAQGPNRSQAEESAEMIQNKETEETKTSDNFVGRSATITTEAGLVPRTVRASISVPSDYIVKVWKEQNPDADLASLTPEVIERMKVEHRQNIEGTVVPLLPKELAKSGFPNVQVSFFQSLTPEPMAEVPPTAVALEWFRDNSNTLLMLSVVGVSLVMLRSVVKGAPAADPLPTVADAALLNRPAAAPAEAEAKQDEKEEKRPKLKFNKGPNLKEDLSDIVREDPDAAAAILRSWIGNAA